MNQGSGRRGFVTVVSVILIALVAYASALVARQPAMSSVAGTASAANADGSAWQVAAQSNEMVTTPEEETTKTAVAVEAALKSNGVGYQTKEIQKRSVKNPSDAKTATVMVYMCGSDLESNYAAASYDLVEMAKANLSDNVNVIVETGGATKWHINRIKNRKNQLWQVRDNDLVKLGEIGQQNMTEPSTLSEFIGYCSQNFPADRNFLVLWDHGGGTSSGYAYDLNYRNSMPMTISEIGNVLRSSGVDFDFVGYDACLMATAADAVAVHESADYLVASQAVEPSTGWYYTDWLTSLSANVSQPTLELGQTIIDSYISNTPRNAQGGVQTLSMVDLSRLSNFSDALDSFATNASSSLAAGSYAALSQARASATSAGDYDSDFGQVDIVQLCKSMPSNPASTALATATRDAVVYNGTTPAAATRCGLSIYYPYRDFSGFNQASEVYDEIGFSKSYLGYLSSFATTMGGGQQQLGSYSGSYGSSSYYSLEDMATALIQTWMQSLYRNKGFYHDNTYDSKALIIEPGENGSTLKLDGDQWRLITGVSQSVLLKRGKGYVSLGDDSSFDVRDGDLEVVYHDDWVALDGQAVPYYDGSYVTNEDGTWIRSGYVPARINGKDCQILLQWTSENEGGQVVGYRQLDTNGTAGRDVVAGEPEESTTGNLVVQAHNNDTLMLAEGDTIEFVAQRYARADSTEPKPVVFGDPVTYHEGALSVGKAGLDTDQSYVRYVLTDIYGNQHATDLIKR